jgi:MurNAc alpha-1-phosphate uridylyltransferase
MTAMILAAGRGERMRPLTDTTPKALLDVAGESLLERHLRMLARRGVNNVVINLHWLGEQIIERIGDGHRYGLQVTYSPESDGALESAGGMQRALPMLGNKPFWAVNADVFTDIDLPELSLADNVMAHLLLVPTPDYKPRGDFDLQHGMLKASENPLLTYSGIALYRPEFFHELNAGRTPLPPMLVAGANAGVISASMLDGAWADIGTVPRLNALRIRCEG